MARSRKHQVKNAWLAHVKEVLKDNRDKSFKQVLKLAKKTYKKSAAASFKNKGSRKSRHFHKTRRGGSKEGGGDGPDMENQNQNQQNQNENSQQQEKGQNSQSGGSASIADTAAPVA